MAKFDKLVQVQEHKEWTGSHAKPKGLKSGEERSQTTKEISPIAEDTEIRKERPMLAVREAPAAPSNAAKPRERFAETAKEQFFQSTGAWPPRSLRIWSHREILGGH